MHNRLLLTFILFFMFTTIGLSVFAQESDTSTTQTPAPSKTPTSTAIASPEESEAPTETITPTPQLTFDEPLRQYTQNDLQILVGNVQRPNGIVWFQNKLYAACSGDFTLYEIDSVTGSTVTFSSGVRDSNTVWIEELENGFNVWMADFDTNQLLRGDHLRGLPAVVVDENLDGPWGLAPVSETQFLITNSLSNNIVLANRDGTSDIVVEGLRYPAGIVVQDDVVFLANRGSARRAIEWFAVSDIDAETVADDITQPLVSGLQNVSNLVLGPDNYLYFTYALAERGVVGRVDPQNCLDGGCTNEEVEIVILTDGRTAPLAGLTISDDFRLFVHTVYDSEIFWVQLYD